MTASVRASRSGARRMSSSACCDPIEDVLDRELPALRVDRVEAEEGQSPEVVERHPNVHALEQPRHDRDLKAQRLALAYERDEQPVRRGAEAKHHMARASLPGGAREVRRAAEYRRPPVGHHVGRRRVGVEIAHREQPELGLAQQPPFDAGADLASAHDQRRAGDQAVHACRLLLPVQKDPGTRDVDRPEHPCPCDQRPRLGAGLEDRRHCYQGDRGKRGGRHHLAEPIHDPLVDGVLVEASNRHEPAREHGHQPDQRLSVVHLRRGAHECGDVSERQRDQVDPEAQRGPDASLEHPLAARPRGDQRLAGGERLVRHDLCGLRCVGVLHSDLESTLSSMGIPARCGRHRASARELYRPCRRELLTVI